MVERPIDEEPPIAATEPAEEAKPKRKRSKKAAAEPASAEAPPDETADDAIPAKPARKRRSKKSEEAAEPEPVGVPAANNDTAEEASGEPRRGWWQKTFG
jgi:ribonuclease E